jgi:hypothetical protein
LPIASAEPRRRLAGPVGTDNYRNDDVFQLLRS